MTIKHHNLKIQPPHFEKIIEGRKTFEIRRNDRGFEVGHSVTLQEYLNGYTGREITANIIYITDFEQKPGFVVMQLAGIALTATTEGMAA